MSLIDLQVDLQETNRQLTRIAEVLERAWPSTDVAADVDPTEMKVHQRPAAGEVWREWSEPLLEKGREVEVMEAAYGPRK